MLISLTIKRTVSEHFLADRDDGVDRNGNPVYFCYDLELWRLKRACGKIEREGKGNQLLF